MKWLRKLLFLFKNLLCGKSKIQLPTIDNPNPPPHKLVNNNEIPFVLIWEDANGKKYFGMVFGGYFHKIHWSFELEYWLKLSGVVIVWIKEEPYDFEFNSAVKVTNIPENLPSPSDNNFQISQKPKI